MPTSCPASRRYPRRERSTRRSRRPSASVARTPLGSSTGSSRRPCERLSRAQIARRSSVGKLPSCRSAHHNESMRLLVVDDDRALREVLRRALMLAGYEVRLTETGAGALAEVSGSIPDAVVLDVGLPDIDGLEVCRLL